MTATQSTSTSKGPVRSGTQKGAGWVVFREVALVDFVEGLEPLRRDAQHIGLQHIVEVRPGGLQRVFTCSRISSSWRSNGAWTRISPV